MTMTGGWAFVGSIALAGIVKRYADVVAVDIPNLVINQGEFVVLLGPSGCGKTTTLRLIAGLEAPSSGEILMDGMVVNSLSPKERNVAMVFQDYALYPHMRVYDNIALNLRVDKIPNCHERFRVVQIVRSDMVDDWRRTGELQGDSDYAPVQDGIPVHEIRVCVCHRRMHTPHMPRYHGCAAEGNEGARCRQKGGLGMVGFPERVRARAGYSLERRKHHRNIAGRVLLYAVLGFYSLYVLYRVRTSECGSDSLSCCNDCGLLRVC